MNFFNIENVHKTPWKKLRKKPGLKKKEKGEYLFDESRRKELENKAYLSEFMAATMFFGSCLVDWMFGSLEITTTFSSLSLFGRFPFTVFREAFLIVFARI